tara:strand:- start:1295 stop:3400 length:2106 start_codon:yes stop_codon:yes gene_type:complete
MNKKMLDIKYFLIVIIIALLGYLIYINYFENKSVENFMQRNSLSSYYQSSDDSDFLDNNQNELRNTVNKIFNNESLWNGSWKFVDHLNNIYYITFVQVNKDLLFVMNKSSFTIVGDDKSQKDPYISNKNDNAQCLPDMIIGKCELNNSEDKFFLKHIFCSNNGDATGNFNVFGEEINDDSINNFYGYFNDDGTVQIIQLSNDGSSQVGQAKCTRDGHFSYGQSATYLLKTSYNVPTPNFKNSIRINPDACYNSSFDDYQKGDLKNCYIQNSGLPTPGDKSGYKDENSKDYSFNSYGTGCAPKKKVKNINGFNACPLDEKETCFIPITSTDGTSSLKNVQNYNKCQTKYDMYLKNQSSLVYPLFKKEEDTKNLLDLCNHLEGFQSGKYNSAILMYVDNLANVETLNFDFFGIKDGENYLTTKLDMMFPFMNNNILNSYRENISDEKSLRLTNCIENQRGTDNFNTILSKCNGEYADVKEKYNKMKSKISQLKNDNQDNMLKKMYDVIGNLEGDISIKESNRILHPTVWTLNFEQNETTKQTLPSYTNDCSFVLGTSNMYNKEGRFEKFAEFDSEKGKTKLNLYKGGNKQKLILENPFIIDSLDMKNNNSNSANTDNNISNDYILMSGNLRTYHPKKYLIPGQGNKFNNFGKEIYLQNDINPSGKWIILGFNITEALDKGSSSNLYTKTLLKTLKKINDTMSQ